MSGEDSNNATADDKATVNSILEMLREAGVSTKDLEEKKHAFWDTQVGVIPVQYGVYVAMAE